MLLDSQSMKKFISLRHDHKSLPTSQLLRQRYSAIGQHNERAYSQSHSSAGSAILHTPPWAIDRASFGSAPPLFKSANSPFQGSLVRVQHRPPPSRARAVLRLYSPRNELILWRFL